MDITIQILTKNNATTIAKTLDSVRRLNGQIIVNDLGSTDKTVEICSNYDVSVLHQALDNDYASLRNRLQEQSETRWQMFLHPGEILLAGHQRLAKVDRSSHLSVVNSGVLLKEVRVWEKGNVFRNPVFEYVDVATDHELDVIIGGSHESDLNEKLQLVQQWRRDKPLAVEPIYYEASVQFMLGCYDEFLRLSEYYMFRNPTMSQSSTMNRYYYALTQFYRYKDVKAALQNLNLCLCHNPLMAEFWCLIGDIHYHLCNDFHRARAFYENAIILGSRRRKKSKWPMEIGKYDQYPRQMIVSCDEITTSLTR